MLTSLVLGVSVYAVGIILDVSYCLARISELKFDFDTTRSKDVKNECTALARHHARGLRSSYLWPLHVFQGLRSALGWVRSLDGK